MKCTCQFSLVAEEGEEEERRASIDISPKKTKSKIRRASPKSYHLTSWNNRTNLAMSLLVSIACVQLFLLGGVGGMPSQDSIASDNANKASSSRSRSVRNSDILFQLVGGKSECAGIIRNVKVVASQSVIGENGESNEEWGEVIIGASPNVTPSQPPSPRYQNLCGSGSTTSLNSSSSSSCCPSTLIPHLLHSPESNLLLTTFNNSFKYTTFKTQATAHLKLIQSYESLSSSNKELWNATIDGLNVLKKWGIKYWDPLYLYKNRVFSEECLRRIAQNNFCYACGVGLEVQSIKPCKSLCHNTVAGCLKSPLAEYIESPWKHAVNSVRTAVRLLTTTGGESGSNSYGVVGGKQDNNRQSLHELIINLNDWREPITWWLDEYKSSRACEGLPSTNCWNGETVGRYESSPVLWRSSYNPEFSSSFTTEGGARGGSWTDPLVTIELDRFRSELVSVRKTLEKFWPTTSSPSHIRTPHALPLSSMEDHRVPEGHHSLVHYEGSGAGEGFESDDEDMEYNNSGYGPHIETDDEDLAMGEYYGSGSGELDSTTYDRGDGLVVTDDGIGVLDNEDNSNDMKGRTPISLSGGERVGSTFALFAMSILLVTSWTVAIPLFPSS